MTPLLDCKLGDEVFEYRARERTIRELWTVAGINTVNGNLYLDLDQRKFTTVTAKSVHLWKRVCNDA